MKKVLVGAALGVILTVGGIYGYSTIPTTTLSDIQLENIDALSEDEGYIDPNDAYGFKMQPCYITNQWGQKVEAGQRCERSTSPRDVCNYLLSWGSCSD